MLTCYESLIQAANRAAVELHPMVLLQVKAKTIKDEMFIAAARALADYGEELAHKTGQQLRSQLHLPLLCSWACASVLSVQTGSPGA